MSDLTATTADGKRHRIVRSLETLVDSVTPKNDDDDEMKLVTFLTKGYNKEVRPVQNKSDAVQVVFGIAYTQLLDLVCKIFSNIFSYIALPFSHCSINHAYRSSPRPIFSRIVLCLVIDYSIVCKKIKSSKRAGDISGRADKGILGNKDAMKTWQFHSFFVRQSSNLTDHFHGRSFFVKNNNFCAIQGAIFSD